MSRMGVLPDHKGLCCLAVRPALRIHSPSSRACGRSHVTRRLNYYRDVNVCRPWPVEPWLRCFGCSWRGTVFRTYNSRRESARGRGSRHDGWVSVVGWKFECRLQHHNGVKPAPGAVRG